MKVLRNPFVPSELKIEVENETAEGKSTDDDPRENYYFSAVGCCHILLYSHMELDRSRCFRRLRIKKLETKDQWMKYAESVLQPFLKIWDDISHKMPCPFYYDVSGFDEHKKFEEYLKHCEFLKKDINLDYDDDDIYLKLRPKIKEYRLTRRLAMFYVKRQLSSENAKIEQFREFMIYLVDNSHWDLLKILEEASRTEQKYPLVSWEWRLKAVELLYVWILTAMKFCDSLPVLNHIIRRMIKQYFCDMKKGEELMEMKNHSTEH